MGYAYWLVHLTWTVPPAVLMTGLYWPFLTRLELYKILTLIGISLVAATPWDSYLIRNRIWFYPPDAIAGPRLFSIPLEEFFFFIVLTYNTSLLYVLTTKPLVLPTYLVRRPRALAVDCVVLAVVFVAAVAAVRSGGRGTYMGFIVVWATPFVAFLWVLSHRFLLALPRKTILLVILVPSVYLCFVDNLVLQRGTWVIENKTKLDIQVLGSLDIEEAFFFFITSLLIVMGLVSIDHAVALAEYEAATSPAADELHLPSYGSIMISYLWRRRDPLDLVFLQSLAEAVDLTSKKSQSMFIGSAIFEGALRIDLIRLYSFYRTVDDLVDDSPDDEAARLAIQQCSEAIKARFGSRWKQADGLQYDWQNCVSGLKEEQLAPCLRSSVAQLPASRLTPEPLSHLLDGMQTDLVFSAPTRSYPIETEKDLETYAYNVAGSVAAAILGLVSHYYHPSTRAELQQRVLRAGEAMGCALQYVNIARDVGRDAAIGRVYIPNSWLRSEGLTAAEIVADPCRSQVVKLRRRMLDKAETTYEANVGAIHELPREIRGPMMTVVDSYLAIGKTVRKLPVESLGWKGKTRLPLLRRLVVVRQALIKANKGRGD
ncbi:phytoene synthase [Ophiocordyceps camponoti-floridani]|uniref:Bifunctional lycopene cyclase/phytoene synthase n=1 Tax=Ophiocordyceps camponoti-floridani TaxID=2030778 RepID=A0A8H4VGD4_9HYPO|nr:phytoene synthase [Ophiocordyceps camponoti-floridani]